MYVAPRDLRAGEATCGLGATSRQDTTKGSVAPHGLRYAGTPMACPRGVAPGRLRARPRKMPFHVVLVEPEIPPNTGNVAEPLGFRTDSHAVRRAGLDYWHMVDVRQHSSLQAAESAIESLRDTESSCQAWFFSGKASQSFFDVPVALGDALVFGRESVGLPEQLLIERQDFVVGLPTLGQVRSLNLANAVAIAIYEGLRRCGALQVDTTRR